MRIVILFVGILASNVLSAQKYTYLRAELGLTTAKMVDNSTQISTRLYSDGAIYGFHLRREVSKMLSFELGYSYIQDFGFCDHHVEVGRFDSHQVPLKANLDIYVYKDRISLFGSFGYLFCIEESGGEGSVTEWDYQEDRIIVVEWKSITESKYNSLFSGSIGSRFRVFDELLLEMELGYTFGFEDLREYNITYLDNSETVQILSVKGKGEYWYLKVGISYPIQRASELIRKGVSSFHR